MIVYDALSAMSLPFLAITLLRLLNFRRVVPEHRNRIVSNTLLVASVLIFIAPAVQKSRAPPRIVAPPGLISARSGRQRGCDATEGQTGART